MSVIINGSGSIAGSDRVGFASLSASSGSSLVGFIQAGSGAVTRTLQDKGRDTVSVKDFGAVGDGVVNDTAAIQAAINHVNAVGGGVVLFPEPSATYKVTTELTTYSNVELRGLGNKPALDFSAQTTGNFIVATGTIGSEIALAADVGRYSLACSSVSAHGAAVGDNYLLVSQRNALSPDSGEWQLGLGTGSIGANYFAEILEISKITSSTSFDFANGLIFPDYKTSAVSETPSTTRDCSTVSGTTTVTLTSGTTVGLIPSMGVSGAGIAANTKISVILSLTTFKITVAATSTGTSTLSLVTYSRASSTIQKINFVEDVCVSNLTFIPGAGANTILFMWCKNSYVNDCVFLMGTSKGTGVQLTHSYRSGGTGCRVAYSNGSPSNAVSTHDPLYNPYKIVSSWDCGWKDCEAENASQPFDVTYTSSKYPTLNSYVVNCRTYNSKGNSITSHSGNYGMLINGCMLLGGSRGPALRTRNTTFTNNIVTGAGPLSYWGVGSSSASYGIALADGFIVDSIVSNNQITGFTYGINILNSSSQGVGFTSRRTLITSNTVRRCEYGIYSSYDDIQSKTSSPSGLLIQNNLFSRIGTYGILIDSYLNASQITNNQFVGPMTNASSYAIWIADNVVSTAIKDNFMVELGITAAIRIPTITDTTTFPVATYPHHCSQLSNNSTPNDGVNTYSGSVGGDNVYYRNGTPLPRTYPVFSATSLRHEWVTGNGVWSVGLDGASTFTFGVSSPTVEFNGGWAYSNSSNIFTVRVGNIGTYAFTPTNFYANTTNTYSLGAASKLWSVVYAGSGSINTSDERSKQQIQDIDAALFRAIRKVDFKQFKFNDAVVKKGDKARWHFGVIAQQVKAAFESEGVDPFTYGILCHDEWDAVPAEVDVDTGAVITEAVSAGNSYGVRYDELLCLKLASLNM